MTETILLRICAATLFGAIIGLEREIRAKGAGFRTHFLVALGSALFMTLSQYGVDDALNIYPNTSFDPSRIASQVVTGIGFIGAGTIIFQRHVVRGLTTAAGLWVTSAIGMACGSGLYLVAGVATLLALFSLEALNPWLSAFGSRNITVKYESDSKDNVMELVSQLRRKGTDIDKLKLSRLRKMDGEVYEVTMDVKIKRRHFEEHISQMLSEYDGVEISME